MDTEIDSKDVLRVIHQFLMEQGLEVSARTLQSESQLTTSCLTEKQKECLSALFDTNRWDQVLAFIQNCCLTLPEHVMTQLYQHIYLEMIHFRELDTARILFDSDIFQTLQKTQPKRWTYLSDLLEVPSPSPFHSSSLDKARKDVSSQILAQIAIGSPSRLLFLLQDALKWKKYTGSLPRTHRFDLMLDSAPLEPPEDSIPVKLDRTIKFAKNSQADALCFSEDGEFLVTGSSDGFIEVWDFETGKLRKDLKFQSENRLMMHNSAVLSIAFSRDSRLIASGSESGDIKVWNVCDGKCIRKYETAHLKGISSISFSMDGSSILSGSFDGLLRVFGLQSGGMLKEFRGHESFVCSASFCMDDQRIISGDANGVVKVWDTRTCEVLVSKRLWDGSTEITAIFPRHRPPQDEFVIASTSSSICIVNANGECTERIQLPEKVSVTGICISPKQKFMYILSSDCVLCRDVDSGKIEHAFKLHKNRVKGIVHHPYRNIMVSYAVDRNVKIWRPQN